MKPGEIILDDHPILINQGRNTRKINVINLGDRPIFVGSHYHFYEVNPNLYFNREPTKGMHLNVPAGIIIQFEPGVEKTVELVEIGGRKLVFGFRGYVNGPVENLFETQISHHYMSRENYVQRYGPTKGDKVRLADTNLFIKVEKDLLVYGDEMVYGWLKTIRSGMGMSSRATREETLDLVITNAIVFDYWGIVKADIGVKDGKIQGIGKSGNPDYMDGVDPRLIVGASTDVIDANGKIVTASGIDPHVHDIYPEVVTTALQSGVTTLLGGGTGPSTGSKGTNITPGAWNLHRMLEAAEEFPMNFGFWARGNALFPEPLEEQLLEGAAGFKVHENWAATPAVINSCLNIADQYDVQVCLHVDSSNESGTVETTSLEAINGRTIHTYHVEGAGGGHEPDLMQMAREGSILPSSTTPTRPFTINSADANIQMLFQVHGVLRSDPVGVTMAKKRIRPETMAAEGNLQDMGVISMMSSDSMAMGHLAETIIRTWQTAHAMKKLRGPLREEKGDNDNFRAKRYICKYTINPAITHGISDVVGSIETGKMADLVIWKPEFFGVKPEQIIKGGFIVHAPIGEANGATSADQPVMYRKTWGAYGKVPEKIAFTFMSKAAKEKGVPEKLGLRKKRKKGHDLK